jgi:hypothetical protein
MYLHLPDAYVSLAGDPRYAVRFANEDVWDAETGMNDLGADIVISRGASEGLDLHRTAPDRAQKIIRDGRIQIIRGDHVYSLLGITIAQ